ncbi:MAG: HD domain-containing protein [Treponema sp.]|nr:HD domain-containing protein [Treponema sp.]
MSVELNSIQAMALEFVLLAISLLLTRKCFSLIKKGMKYFFIFMISLDLFLLVNIPIRLFEVKIHIINSDIIFWLYSIAIVLMTSTMFFCFLVLLKYMNSRIVNSGTRVFLLSIPVFLTIPLCIINKSTGWLFWIESDTYYRGNLFFLQGMIAYAYLFINLLWLIKCSLDKKKRKAACIGLFSILPGILFIILQVLFGGSFLLAGITISAAIMYIDICLDKQKTSEVIEMKEMFVQITETLASAIDAKDEYTHGHSIRVAQYSRQIAEIAGLSEEECEKVYFSALLHDVGKIGIPDWILNKKEKLNDEEFSFIMQHPILGREILAHIRKLPYLTMGTKYHHERYDGLGYPDRLKATDIPVYARIIAVADAYDAMTSSRSYRDPLPQDVVREEIVKGSGRQFDPEFASIMVQIIDEDKFYKKKQNKNFNELYCVGSYNNSYPGIPITPFELTIKMKSEKLAKGPDNLPVFILFDAVDSRVHIEDQEKKFYSYSEYFSIRVDGEYKSETSRKVEVKVNQLKERVDNTDEQLNIVLKAVKRKDHILLSINDGYTEIKATIVVSDGSRFAFVGITGQQCYIRDITEERSSEIFPEASIQRIADEIKYFNKPDGDIPNIQVESWRTTTSESIPVNKSLKLSFHMHSLPFARLIWHCPFVILFESDDGKIYGKNYRELAFIRFDGESWQEDPYSTNSHTITKTEQFENWNNWKIGNKKGRKLTLSVDREDNKIFFHTECGGLILDNTTTISNEKECKNLYLALTGDQVIIEAVKILEKN